MAIPLSFTDLYIVKGVPFNNDYKNVRWFTNESSQFSYFNSLTKVHSMTGKTFQREKEQSFVRVNLHKDKLLNANYLFFRNDKKWYYCFITDLEYRSENVTNVYFELDVIQTWMFDINFKPSYVVREHQKLWNSDGSPVVNTLDEQLHYGSHYETVDIKEYMPIENTLFLVIVTKSLLHNENENQKENDINPQFVGLPQPLSYYILPFKPNGGTIPFKTESSPKRTYNVINVLKSIYSMSQSVNNVVSLYVTEYIGTNPTLQDGTLTFVDSRFSIAEIADDVQENISLLYVKDSKSFARTDKNFGNKYDGFRNVDESKLLMYPYAVTYLDDGRGNRVTIRNEYINGNNLTITARGSIGTSAHVWYTPNQYLLHETSGHISASGEHSLKNSNPNDLPIVNDMLAAFFQGNRNTFANQKLQAERNALFDGLNVGSNLVGAFRNGDVGGLVDGAQSMVNIHHNIQSYNAKISDISNQPPSLQQLGTNVNFDFGNGLRGLYIIKKQIRKEYIDRLTDYFKMFGYKTNRLKIPNLRTRQNWNYVQTEGCNIIGNFNQTDLEKIKRVFDNGVTLWHTNDIGNYNLANGVR